MNNISIYIVIYIYYYIYILIYHICYINIYLFIIYIYIFTIHIYCVFAILQTDTRWLLGIKLTQLSNRESVNYGGFCPSGQNNLNCLLGNRRQFRSWKMTYFMEGNNRGSYLTRPIIKLYQIYNPRLLS